jgi:hypothetical protein
MQRILLLREYGYAGRWMLAGYRGKHGACYVLDRYSAARRIDRFLSWPQDVSSFPGRRSLRRPLLSRRLPVLRYQLGWPE